MNKNWFTHEIRVRYQETDQMGVVYHTNYLNWFEIGRTEMVRQMGLPYRTLEERGLLLPVIEAELKFKLPARYDDLITIYTSVEQFDHVRVSFECQIRRQSEQGHVPEYASTNEPEGELLVSGITRHVWLNRAWRPTRIDKEAPDLFELLRNASEGGR